MTEREREVHRGEPVIQASKLTLGYADPHVIEKLSLSIEAATITALVGPNGSGKSTVLKGMARMLSPREGSVYLNGHAIVRMPTREIARQLTMLPQGPSAPDELTVAELVEQGRYPHIGPFRPLGRQDRVAIERALTQTGLDVLRDRRLDSLSGGERQRAWIALALAQEAPLLLLDEPTTFLDIAHQLEVLALIRELNTTRDMTFVLVLHDLNQAARYADRMIVMRDGRVVADGRPGAVLTEGMLEDVFRVRARVITHPDDGVPICLPYAALES